MKSFVKNLVNIVNNNRVAAIATLVFSILAGLLYQSVGSAVGVAFCAIGIAVFAQAWKGVEEDEHSFAWRCFFFAAILFLSCALLAAVGGILEMYAIPGEHFLGRIAFCLGHVSLVIVAALFMWLIFKGLAMLWNAIVRWAK